jgi:arylsulfatase A-like enzyme
VDQSQLSRRTPAESGAEMNKPNIIFILTDDQRYDMIGSLFTFSEVMTPNLDRLAARGTAFTHAHIPGGTSGAVCMPSRAMIHSGRRLFHIGGEGQDIPAEHVTLGQTLGMAGYDTFGTGKWHNGPPAFSRSFTSGDSIFFGGMWDHWNVPLCEYDPYGNYDNKINFVANWMHGNETASVHCDRFVPGRHSSELLTDTAINYINRHGGKAPFFLYLAYLAPHDPRTMPERFRAMYQPDTVTLPPNYRAEREVDIPFYTEIRDEALAGYPRDEDEIRRHIADYYAMITHLDREIGRLLDAVEAAGKTEETIIVFASDNGLACGQHGLMGKQSCYDHSIRVPLIFAGPGVPRGKTVSQYAYLFDIYPTLCDLVGIDIPPTVEGKSLHKMFSGDTHVNYDTMYFAMNEHIRAVKDERFKLIVYGGGRRRNLLFDLSVDPFEVFDLSNSENHRDTLIRLRDELYRLGIEWDDRSHRLGRIFWESVFPRSDLRDAGKSPCRGYTAT